MTEAYPNPDRVAGGVALSQDRDLDGVVAVAFDGAALPELLHSPYGVVRAEYVHALGAADQYIPEVWRVALNDAESGVRAQALAAIRLLADPPAEEFGRAR